MKIQEKGQSLLELILAVGIFTIVIGGLAYLLLDGYFSGRLAGEITRADYLAQEGLEAAKSIRDNNFDDLTAGARGLAISGGRWVFQGSEEDISFQLRNGRRVIEIEDIDQNRKKATSRVNWQFSEAMAKEVKLVTYFTDWQKAEVPPTEIEIRKPTSYTDYRPYKTQSPELAYDDPNGDTLATTKYGDTRDPSIVFYNWQLPTKEYTSLVLKYRYQADQGVDDQYAVAYSLTGCAGPFIDLISPTSIGAADTTILTNLSFNQDLSQLCLKIYSEKVKKSDQKNIYTRDIWTEGAYLP